MVQRLEELEEEVKSLTKEFRAGNRARALESYNTSEAQLQMVQLAFMYQWKSTIGAVILTWKQLYHIDRTTLLLPLFHAVRLGQDRKTQSLLMSHADPRWRNPEPHFNPNGDTLVGVAAKYGRLACLHLVLKYGADLKLANTGNRSTPLHQAVQSESMPVVETLVRGNADVMARDKDGKTAIDVAKETGNGDVLQVLKQYTEPPAPMDELPHRWVFQGSSLSP